MSLGDIRYWQRRFSYDRSHIIKNKVAIEVYRILIHYTRIHKNCRVGAYIAKSFASEFYSLDQLIPNFDAFSEVAISQTNILPNKYPDYIKNLWGPTCYESMEAVWQLKYPIWFEFESKSWYKSFLGYKLGRNSLGIKIDPSDINALTGESLRYFKISIKDYCLEVRFGDEIRII
jgi:hypothetical protein